MLQTWNNKIKELELQAKQQIIESFESNLEVDKSKFFIVTFSDLQNNWQSDFYDNNLQIKKLIEYVNKTRNISSISTTYQEIVSKGKSPAFRYMTFNKAVQEIISNIL